MLGRTPTHAAASATEPPAATKAASTSTWGAVGVVGDSWRRPSSTPPCTSSGRTSVRLPVGIENVEDLWADLDTALRAALD